MVSNVNNDLSIETIVRKSLNYLEKTNPDDIVIFGTDQVQFQLRFSKNNILVSKRWASLDLDLYYVNDNKIAATKISDIASLKTVFKALDELISFGKAIPPKEDYGGIAEGPFKYKPVDNLYDKRLLDFKDYAVDHVEQGINEAIAAGAINNAGVLQWGITTQYLYTNHGVENEQRYTNVEFLIRSFLEPTESGQGLSVGRMLNSLDSAQAGREAGTIAKLSRGGKSTKGGTYNALFSPTVVADIVAQTISGANPFSIEIGQSWLRDKIGKKIGSELFTAHDDATVSNGLRSRRFDAEGVPSQKTTIIDEGILKNLIHNTSTAKKTGTKSTANAGLIVPQNTNLIIEPGTHTFDELISESKNPTVYVTSNWYTRTTNAVEGVFSTIPRDGMFLIEKGEIQKPIRELRISDSFPNLVKNIVAIQNKTRQIKWWLEVTIPTFAPAMLIENVNFSTGTR